MTYRKAKAPLAAKFGLAMCLFLVGPGGDVCLAEAKTASPLTADQVVKRLMEMNAQRALALESYRGTRIYHLEYHGLSSKSAELVVAMVYRQPDEKRFCILSESGSELLQEKVLKKLLEAEVEAMQEDHRRLTAMDPENYEFRLVDVERILDQDFFVLEVKPRKKSKFLFRGLIWVEGKDFAVARMEGEPAKSPSWWTKRNAIDFTYKKVDEFWLPARNETSTHVRIVGRSFLTIDYQDYEILNGSALGAPPESEGITRCPVEPAQFTGARP